MTAKQAKVTKFGPSYTGDYPAEMRTQLWPLCCGARIISGFKNAHNLSVDELVTQINDTIEAVPDHQVYSHEAMKPKLVFLTLNEGQTASKKIMDAVAKCGFMKFADAKPRGGTQSFFVLDQSKSFKIVS